MEDYMKDLLERRKGKSPNYMWKSYCNPQQSSVIKVLTGVEKPKKNVFTKTRLRENRTTKTTFNFLSNVQIEALVNEAEEEVFKEDSPSFWRNISGDRPSQQKVMYSETNCKMPIAKFSNEPDIMGTFNENLDVNQNLRSVVHERFNDESPNCVGFFFLS